MATNPFEVFKQLQGLQSRVGEIQEKLKAVHVTGSAGGGLVTVDMNGQMQVEKVTIAPEAVDPRDIALLQDLVLAAVNDAVRVADARGKELTAQMLGPLAGSLNIPGLM